MNWKDIAGAVGGIAPTLGTLLGGPAGGAIGSLISAALGTSNTPDAVAQALKTDPEAAVKLQQIQATHAEAMAKIEADAQTNAIESVNQTMQTEAKSEHWPEWAWRPFIGFITGFAFLAVCIQIGIMVVAHPTELANVPLIVGAYSTLFAIPGGILGVSAWHRGVMQRIQAQQKA